MKSTIGELKRKQALLGKVDLGVNDKLTYAVKRLSTRIELAIKPAFDDVQEAVTDFTIDQASVDEKGQLILINDKHQFTPEARKALLKFVSAQNKNFDEREIDIEPYLVADITAPGFQRAATLFDEFDVEELTGLLF